MASLAQSGSFTLSADALDALRATFSAGRADAEETEASIRTVARENGYYVDPHTAVAVAVAEKEPRDPAIPMIVLGTAHPAKSPDAMQAACGVRPPLPAWLSDLDTRSERVKVLAADQGEVERHILSTTRAAREGAAA
jgi:threonine synthase